MTATPIQVSGAAGRIKVGAAGIMTSAAITPDMSSHQPVMTRESPPDSIRALVQREPVIQTIAAAMQKSCPANLPPS